MLLDAAVPALALLGRRSGFPNAGHGGKAGKKSSLNVGARNPCPQLALSRVSVSLTRYESATRAVALSSKALFPS